MRESRWRRGGMSAHRIASAAAAGAAVPRSGHPSLSRRAGPLPQTWLEGRRAQGLHHQHPPFLQVDVRPRGQAPGPRQGLLQRDGGGVPVDGARPPLAGVAQPGREARAPDTRRPGGAGEARCTCVA